MDWSKAKNILILTFLALNIFLGYSLWKESYQLFSSRVVTYQEIEEAKQKLSSLNLELKAPIPRQIYFMSFLAVTNKKYPGEELVDMLFPGEHAADFYSGEEGFVVFQEGERELRVWDKGKVTFSREPFSLSEAEAEAEGEEEGEGMVDTNETTDMEDMQDREDVQDINKMEEKEAISMAQEFLQEMGVSPLEARLEEVEAFEDGRYFLLYNQVYKNQALFGSYLKLWLHPEGVENFQLYWLEPEGFSGEDISTISAASALISLSEFLSAQEKKKEIESISIGYYSEAFDAQKWEIVPVWRIKITDQGIYFINAYTGDLEGKDESYF